MTEKSFSTTALVLKRQAIGETDRLVTLLTDKRGKITCLAKGVRKIKSSQRAYLEPGNLIKAFLIHTKSLPLLTQSTLIDDLAKLRSNLVKIRQITQLLEIIDRLFVEEEIDLELFKKILHIRGDLMQAHCSKKQIKKNIAQLLIQLGYQDPAATKHQSILDYVAELSDRKMYSFDFLKI